MLHIKSLNFTHFYVIINLKGRKFMNNKNYYEILQINKNASPEIIEKAYKTLVKKYHPDIQENTNKEHAENLMKEINEAYETLSNLQKKAIYDQSLSETEISLEDLQNLYNENKNLKNELNNLKKNNNNFDNQLHVQNNVSNISNNYQTDINDQQQNSQYEQKIQQAVNQAYYDAYIQDLKNRGYKIKYKKTFKQHIESLISVIITIFILFIIFQIPFVKKFFINLYNENIAFKMIIDFFINIFSNFSN